MAYIYLQPGQKHWEVSDKLTELGGVRGMDFAMEFAWDGTHMFAVKPELHEKWLAATRTDFADSDAGDASAATDGQGETEDSAATAEPEANDGGAEDTRSPIQRASGKDRPTKKDDAPKAEAQPATDSGDNSTTVEKTASNKETTPEEAGDKTDGQAQGADDANGTASSNSSSGTTKRSATKNSSRRS